MNHNMTQPCERCPFRNDLPHGYLTAERITEIAESLFSGHSFPCHKTTEEVVDEEGFGDMEPTADSEQCAGAEIFLNKQGTSTQLGRIAERLGMAATLETDSPVCASVEEMLAVHGHEDEGGEHCWIVNPGCEAPAGMMVGGGIVPGLEWAEFECHECCQPVCGNCSRLHEDKRVCDDCMEYIENGED